MNELLELMLILQTTIQKYYPYLIQLTLLLWLILCINKASNFRISILGIFPRKIWSLMGIIFSPFLHASFAHLFYNLIPLLALSLLLLAFGPAFYWNLTWILILLTGFFIWLFARPGIHIGASGLISAYWGFLVTQALLGQFQIYHLVIAFICIYYFFGIFLGIFPQETRVSWEGHLFGLLSGVMVFILGTKIRLIYSWVFVPPFLFHCPSFLVN